MAIKAKIRRSRRVCGPCKACCTAIGVKEIGKDTYQKCPYTCDKGCSIYSKRPGSCGSYKCSWLQGKFKKEDRPDLLGAIFESQMSLLGDTLMVWPMSQEALDNPRLHEIVNGEALNRPVWLLTPYPDKRFILCPQRLLESIRERFSAAGGDPTWVVTQMADLPAEDLVCPWPEDWR